MPLQEFQPYQVGVCDCGAQLWQGDDMRYPCWIGGDPDCEHETEEKETEDND